MPCGPLDTRLDGGLWLGTVYICVYICTNVAGMDTSGTDLCTVCSLTICSVNVCVSVGLLEKAMPSS